MRRSRQARKRAAKRRIAVVTGTRAEFGLLEPILRAIRKRPRLESRLIVTGMHLLPKFGRTIGQIRKAGWHVDAAVRMQGGQGRIGEQPLALSRGIAGIAKAIDRLKCDAVLVLGDRIEAFAGACAASVGRRVLLHVHGGDRAVGEMDDLYRDAISRLAHVHFAASKDAVKRLRRMGEPKSRIYQVGAPGLDDIRSFRDGLARDRRQGGHVVCRLLGPLSDRPFAVVIQHPIGRSDEAEAATMCRILAAASRGGLTGAILYPNSDPGHQGIIAEIRRWTGDRGWRVFRSLPRPEYLCLASWAAVLVGNSSSGIIESASLGVPAVNIGPRQQGRLRCGWSVIDAADNPRAIMQAIRKALRIGRPDPTSSVYGDGRSGERIAGLIERLLSTPDLSALTRKRLVY